MRTSHFMLLSVLLAMAIIVNGQEQKTEQVKKGYSFGLLPTISFDADMGFQYGGLVSVYDYGDGKIYPSYKQMVKVEVSRYTKGSGTNQLFYDAKNLLPHHLRLTADLSYLTEKSLDFYGFNGYQSIFDIDLTDKDADDYISRVFYRNQRKMFRFTLDLQGRLYGDHLRWLGGIGIMNMKMGRVDFNSINKGKKDEDILKDTTTLYDKYVDWGIISQEEKDGGNANFLKAGIVYDTRDNEANAMKGMWSEALITYAPGFMFNPEFNYAKLVLIHRQYFTLIKDRLSFVYRLGYQGTIGGDAPFFMQPYMLSSYSSITKTDGLGGAKTLRGIMRDRVVGDGIAYGNLEVRWKFLKTHVGKQNLYMALNGFSDFGMVVQEINLNRANITQADQDTYFDFSYEKDKLHPSVGAGLRIALNENFILAVDYGFALNQKDGAKGLYINIGNLF
ncbi:MAG: BamA/TamA family outer membrane protein [Bacteroidales bacterium]|nr:BamA/TamA family outer membrane protein [Bacteroidales bacterium]